MIPTVITERQRIIAEFFWQKSLTELSAEQVQEALDCNRLGFLQEFLDEKILDLPC